MNRFFLMIGVLVLVGGGVVFSQETEEKATETGEVSNEAALPPLSAEEYLVCPKDVLEILVVGEMEFTGKFEVRREGTIKYPYIGYVPVAGLTVKEIEKRLTDDLKDGYLINPQINVRVDVYSEKFVYVGGEVKRPGRIAFTGRNKMTLYMAIIMAGDFTKDAKKTNVVLQTTDDEGKEKQVEVDVSDIIKGRTADPPVKADDKITVRERFF